MLAGILQAAQVVFIIDRARPTSSRHIASMSPVGRLDLAFDLIECKGVISPFVPNSARRRWYENRSRSDRRSRAQSSRSGQAMRCIRPLAATAVKLKPPRCGAEAASGHGTICGELSVGSASAAWKPPRMAATPHKPRRYRADGGGPHQGQDDTAVSVSWVCPRFYVVGRIFGSDDGVGYSGMRAATRASRSRRKTR